MRRGRALNGETVSDRGRLIAGDPVEPPKSTCVRGRAPICDCQACKAVREAAKRQQAKDQK